MEKAADQLDISLETKVILQWKCYNHSCVYNMGGTLQIQLSEKKVCITHTPKMNSSLGLEIYLTCSVLLINGEPFLMVFNSVKRITSTCMKHNDE